MLAYRFLRALFRFAVRIFFRRIEVVGLEHVPDEGQGAVIFCGNHPNSLLDPVLVTVFCGRFVNFAAKDVLFQSRILRYLLNIFGAVPVKRRKDHPDGPLDNSSMFDALFDVLGAGRTMGIFPEGISHNASQLSQLKTGAARIALGAKKRFPEQSIQLISVGLHYVHRNRFRSSVLIQFGPPIPVTAEKLAAFEADDRLASRELTDEIEGSLRALTVNAEDWDTLRILDGVRRLYQPPKITLQQRVELARRFNTVFPEIKERPEAKKLLELVREYLVQLSALGLTDRDLQRGLTAGQIWLRCMRHIVLVLVFLPLAAIGSILHVPLSLLFGWTGEQFAPRKDVVATTKFLVGLVGILLVYLAIASVGAYLYGLAGFLFLALLLPLSGFATIRVIERIQVIKRLMFATPRLLTLNSEINRLRQERARLEEAVIAAVNQFIPDDMVPLFPRDSAAPLDELLQPAGG